MFKVPTLKATNVATAAALALLAPAVALPATAQANEIVVVVNAITALDRIDLAGRADFYARVTIDGEAFKTERIRAENAITPNWTFRKKVGKRRTYPVKIEIFDKNVLSKDDLIDINRVDGKRDLDFRVDVRSCRVLDFSPTVKCGTSITRAGGERKKAELTFTVSVTK